MEVVPHDPRWITAALAERESLAAVLGPWLVDGVEHVGSTAVPGLAAKPIVDLMASVTDAAAVAAEAASRLAAAGWHFVPPELDGRPWRRFFVKPDATGRRRAAHLHLVASGHPRWADQLAFRDLLRRDGNVAERYEQLKLGLAKRHGHDREAYSRAKGEFIARALA
ncbi:GrpB family protein [Amycolatopsis acidiphila]|uniref:GrpB family protein n=1 Tax=Amycolatopsis acidiphila TaxID=715473 RepID=UPI00198D9DE7|nr:GrpB family protein [Amycolatopsis acidiphila]UIJ58716.1 GrpB family protein [Amycolatopsis acidiphila]GHG75867.1 hypothetical protein GCM10017788_40850 [Amycolatopsis acidiphila]